MFPSPLTICFIYAIRGDSSGPALDLCGIIFFYLARNSAETSTQYLRAIQVFSNTYVGTVQTSTSKNYRLA